MAPCLISRIQSFNTKDNIGPDIRLPASHPSHNTTRIQPLPTTDIQDTVITHHRYPGYSHSTPKITLDLIYSSLPLIHHITQPGYSHYPPQIPRIQSLPTTDTQDTVITHHRYPGYSHSTPKISWIHSLRTTDIQ
jgi:hypothetical protein